MGVDIDGAVLCLGMSFVVLEDVVVAVGVDVDVVVGVAGVAPVFVVISYLSLYLSLSARAFQGPDVILEAFGFEFAAQAPAFARDDTVPLSCAR